MFLAVLALVSAVETPIAEAETMAQCETSHVAVYASGFAHFEVMNTCGSAAFSFQSGLRKITADEVDRLKTIVANAKVESLPARIEPPANLVTTEETVLGLRVWIKGEMREIIAYGVDRAENQDAVRRFQSVRQAVEKLGSAPR